jgi:hypothetical protein
MCRSGRQCQPRSATQSSVLNSMSLRMSGPPRQRRRPRSSTRRAEAGSSGPPLRYRGHAHAGRCAAPEGNVRRRRRAEARLGTAQRSDREIGGSAPAANAQATRRVAGRPRPLRRPAVAAGRPRWPDRKRKTCGASTATRLAHCKDALRGSRLRCSLPATAWTCAALGCVEVDASRRRSMRNGSSTRSLEGLSPLELVSRVRSLAHHRRHDVGRRNRWQSHASPTC